MAHNRAAASLQDFEPGRLTRRQAHSEPRLHNGGGRRGGWSRGRPGSEI